MIKIALAGAHGKMGREIAQLAELDPQFQLVASLVRGTNHSTIYNNTHLFDVMIDFSVKEALSTHIELCQKTKSAMVIGITGLSEDDKTYLRNASKQIPIVYASNMSIGVNLTFKALEMLAKNLNHSNSKITPDNNIAIHEVHHKLKKDAPSGTAIKMREMILESLGEGANGQDIPITSHRLGEIPGEHTVVFALPGERIELTHIAENRTIFARGALHAAKWVVGKPPGLYDMQDVLGLNRVT